MRNVFTLLLILLSGSAFAQTNVNLNLMPYAGTSPFSLNTQYSEFDGDQYKLDRAQYYLSEFILEHDGGIRDTLGSTYLLVDANTTAYSLGNLNITNLESITFSVGVPQAVNHQDPNQWASNHPLAPKSPNMHWGWTAGYKFFAFEGMGDADGDNNPTDVFQFHGVGDQYYKTFTVATTPSASGGNLDINIEVDFTEWLRTVNLGNAGIVHGGGSVIQTISTNPNWYPVFRVPGTVGVKQDMERLQSSVAFSYVDPSQPILHFNAEVAGNLNVSVIDLTGKTLLADHLGKTNGTYQMPALAAGVYICSLNDENGTPLASSKFTVR